MTASNRSMPSADVIPVLHYPDVRAAVEWLGAAFGFRERLRIADHRAQLSVGAGSIVVAASGAANAPPTGQSVMVRVRDVDAHCARARAAGARIVQEPSTFPYGERQYSAVDAGGHTWTFSQTVEDVDPASWGGVLTTDTPEGA
jgi:uncharacterized glyoxalase superfamily protein PhnB